MPPLNLIIAVVACAGCDFGTQECITDPEEHVRDPATAECIVLSNQDGCQYCFDSCVVGDSHRFDYGACFDDACTRATEADCLTSPGCRAAYAGASFFMCLSTAPSGALHDGTCDGLDAYQCSRHDNCSARYVQPTSGSRTFERCVDEAPPAA